VIIMIKISKHASQGMKKRGVSGIDLMECLEHGEVIMEEINGRFGLKKYSKLIGKESDLIVIWFFNKKGDKEVVTAYWRRRR
jgi:hypothetical protein